jgi:hypothetical protein
VKCDNSNNSSVSLVPLINSESILLTFLAKMFRPTSNAIRTFSRSFGRPQLANARRRLHAQAEKIPGSNAQKFAVVAAAGLAGLTAYQFVGRESDIHADAIPIAAETRKQRISAQHIQVQSSLENPGVYVWGDNR